MSHKPSFTITIELGNAAMETAEDIAAALRKLADQLDQGQHVPHQTRCVKDVNGNVVGEAHWDGPMDDWDLPVVDWSL